MKYLTGSITAIAICLILTDLGSAVGLGNSINDAANSPNPLSGANGGGSGGWGGYGAWVAQMQSYFSTIGGWGSTNGWGYSGPGIGSIAPNLDAMINSGGYGGS